MSEPLAVINRRAASRAIAEQEAAFSLGERNETDMWRPEPG